MPIPVLAIIALPLFVFLAGCTPSPALRSVLDLGEQLTHQEKTEQSAPTVNPAYRYLRVKVDDRVAFFVLGYLDPHPEGMTEVWFSAQKEVLRLRQGRIMGVTGTATEWLNVAYQRVPAWSKGMSGTAYERVRDVAPGYRYGISEILQLQPVMAPENSSLLGIAPESLSWYMESALGSRTLKPTLYALRKDENDPLVVYSETCLATDLCFSWQRWPAN